MSADIKENADLELNSINDSCQTKVDLKHSFIEDFNKTILDKQKEEQKLELEQDLIKEVCQSPEEIQRTMQLLLPRISPRGIPLFGTFEEEPRAG